MTSSPATSVAELETASAMPLGLKDFELLGVDVFNPLRYSGHKVAIKGVLIQTAGSSPYERHFPADTRRHLRLAPMPAANTRLISICTGAMRRDPCGRLVGRLTGASHAARPGSRYGRKGPAHRYSGSSIQRVCRVH